MTLLQWQHPRVTAGLTFEAGRVTETAPVLAWTRGMGAHELMSAAAYYGATLVEIGAPASTLDTPTVSASQVATWRGCRRKWAFSRCRPRIENQWAQFGTRTHTVLERYHTHAEVPDPSTPEGQCALPALPLVPPPHAPGTVAEHAFAFVHDGSTLTPVIVTHDGHAYTATFEGRTHTVPAPIDLPEDELAKRWSDAVKGAVGPLDTARTGRVLYTGRIDLIDDYRPDERVRVSDYKTTGDLPERVEEMRGAFEEDAQRVMYGAYARARFEAPAVVTRWLYLQRPHGKVRPRCEPVEMIEGVNINDRMKRLHRTDGLAIVRAHGQPPEASPRNLSHCGAYGGCPYKSECWSTLSPEERAAALLADSNGRDKTMTQPNGTGSNFLAGLAASVGMAAAPTPAPTAPPVTDPRSSWGPEDHEAFNAIQQTAAGQTPYTLDAILDFCDKNGRSHVSGFYRSQNMTAPAVAPVTTTPAPAATRRRTKKAAETLVVNANVPAEVVVPAPSSNDQLLLRIACALERIADSYDRGDE